MHPAKSPLNEQFPALRGALLALAAALSFGISTPLVQYFGRGVGPFATAALLYAGAALCGALLRQPVQREARLRRGDWASVASMAAFGAVLGPVALAWGLARTSGASASLMLSLEAVFTAVLARLWYHESMDRRVTAAVLLLAAGGMLLMFDRVATGASQTVGLLAVAAATAAWGVDNALSRRVAARDPGQVVLAKGMLGALATTLLAAATGAPLPALHASLGLLAVGATGYGLSLHLYLLAQRRFGAARTGSVFAIAPFVGAATAFALGERDVGPGMLGGGLLMAAGIALHLMERHSHEHRHDVLEHEHAHVHDDGHHLHGHGHEPGHEPGHGPGHEHEPEHGSGRTGMPVGAHSHRHRHDVVQHAHPHVPDEHHTHRH